MLERKSPGAFVRPRVLLCVGHKDFRHELIDLQTSDLSVNPLSVQSFLSFYASPFSHFDFRCFVFWPISASKQPPLKIFSADIGPGTLKGLRKLEKRYIMSIFSVSYIFYLFTFFLRLIYIWLSVKELSTADQGKKF